MEVKNEEHLKKMYVDYLCSLINQSKYHKVRVFTSLNRMDITYYGRKWYQRNETQEYRVKDLDKLIQFIYKVCVLIYEDCMLFPSSWTERVILTYDKWIEENFTNEIRLY